MGRYVFTNLEDSELPLTTFSYNGEHFAIPQGVEIDLPDEVADHLNEITYPKYLISKDAMTGEVKHIPIPGKRRFSVMPAKVKKAAVK